MVELSRCRCPRFPRAPPKKIKAQCCLDVPPMPLSPTPPNGREWTVKCMMVSFTMAPPEMVFLFRFVVQFWSRKATRFERHTQQAEGRWTWAYLSTRSTLALFLENR